MDLAETVWFASFPFFLVKRLEAGGEIWEVEPLSTYPPPRKEEEKCQQQDPRECEEKSRPLKYIKAPNARTSWDTGISVGLETPARHLRSGTHNSGEPWRGHPAGKVCTGTVLNSGQLCNLFLWGQGLRGWSNQWYTINRALSPTEQACPGSSELTSCISSPGAQILWSKDSLGGTAMGPQGAPVLHWWSSLRPDCILGKDCNPLLSRRRVPLVLAGGRHAEMTCIIWRVVSTSPSQCGVSQNSPFTLSWQIMAFKIVAGPSAWVPELERTEWAPPHCVPSADLWWNLE